MIPPPPITDFPLLYIFFQLYSQLQKAESKYCSFSVNFKYIFLLLIFFPLLFKLRENVSLFNTGHKTDP